MRLEGAPSWCEVAGGATLGHRPEHLPSQSLRVVEHRIASRSGPPLGAICAAFPVNTMPRALELEALAMASELATLAIETSRLYSDLVRRSEFDLLTDIRNRFSLEKRLKTLIDVARESAGIFGLIYIDLDNFKDVNDNFGHQTGDLYLREATQRMKRQVRPGDTLARLGGDEFAVLVPHVHRRVEVEEIAHRLEHCFSEVFVLDEHIVHGSASIGFALYPENGATVDSLLKAADDAMYAVKRKRPDENQASS
jgi:diguanylate cyclase (GGDEF)-like protein